MMTSFKKNPLKILSGAFVFLAATAETAFAHSGHGSGFSVGFIHPLMGADHILAMLAVGLWAATRGGNSLWIWPLSFISAMICGFILTQANVAVPYLEPMILSTVILLGAAIALRLAAPISLGAVAIALAGLAHGFAHGNEVQAALIPFASGFALSTFILHAAGLGLGLGIERFNAQALLRITGGLIIVAGASMALA